MIWVGMKTLNCLQFSQYLQKFQSGKIAVKHRNYSCLSLSSKWCGGVREEIPQLQLQRIITTSFTFLGFSRADIGHSPVWRQYAGWCVIRDNYNSNYCIISDNIWSFVSIRSTVPHETCQLVILQIIRFVFTILHLPTIYIFRRK